MNYTTKIKKKKKSSSFEWGAIDNWRCSGQTSKNTTKRFRKQESSVTVKEQGNMRVEIKIIYQKP